MPVIVAVVVGGGVIVTVRVHFCRPVCMCARILLAMCSCRVFGCRRCRNCFRAFLLASVHVHAHICELCVLVLLLFVPFSAALAYVRALSEGLRVMPP